MCNRNLKLENNIMAIQKHFIWQCFFKWLTLNYQVGRKRNSLKLEIKEKRDVYRSERDHRAYAIQNILEQNLKH